MTGKNTFKKNIVNCNGGGIYAEGSELFFAGDTVFQGNRAIGGYGGGISANASEVYFEGEITIAGNDAHYGGGIAALVPSGMSTFTGNTADFGGGGIYMSSLTFIAQGYGTLADNSAIIGTGGVISGKCKSEIAFIGVYHFANNLAFVHGGAMALEGSTLQLIHETTFSGNSASEGGALFAYPGCDLTLSGILCCRFFQWTWWRHEHIW